MHDNQGVYGDYNLPGATSPYPRDYILDLDGVVRLAKHEYEPGVMIAVIETLLGNVTSLNERSPNSLPQSPVLLSFFPNPFNPDGRINFELQADRNVSIKIMDVRGRLVQELLHDQPLQAGQHSIYLDGEALYSGVFFIILDVGIERVVQKIVKLR